MGPPWVIVVPLPPPKLGLTPLSREPTGDLAYVIFTPRIRIFPIAAMAAQVVKGIRRLATATASTVLLGVSSSRPDSALTIACTLREDTGSHTQLLGNVPATIDLVTRPDVHGEWSTRLK